MDGGAGALRPTLYLVAPASVGSWFSFFVAPEAEDEVVFTGEGEEVDADAILATLREREALLPVVLPCHETLGRDCELVELLRAHGHAAVGPSPASVAVGVDKLRMKRFFERHGIASPAWANGSGLDGLGEAGATVVIKERRGTQSVGTRLARLGECALDGDELCELYTDGVEYSAVVYRDPGHELVFPPIWKGETTPELIPPWRRLRVCPEPGLDALLEARLRDVARRIARAIDLQGLLEVEYLVTSAGDVLVLEINPRIAGTMRLAAMASRLPIFSLHKLPRGDADVRATRCAAEIPYAGPPISDPQADVFATSRLTAAGRTFAEVRRKLERAVAAPLESDLLPSFA